MEAYCVKCKATKGMTNEHEDVSANGRKMMKGECPDCGTKMNRFLKG